MNSSLLNSGYFITEIATKTGIMVLIVTFSKGWSGGAMVLGKLPVPGCPTIWIIVGQGPIVLEVGAGGEGGGGSWLDIFILIFSLLFLPFSGRWPRYRLKHCFKGPLNPKQPTNQSLLVHFESSYFC